MAIVPDGHVPQEEPAWFEKMGHRFPVKGRPYRAFGGPLDGDWIIWDCLDCNAGLLGAAEPGVNAAELFIAALEAAGCDPRPVEEVP